MRRQRRGCPRRVDHRVASCAAVAGSGGGGAAAAPADGGGADASARQHGSSHGVIVSHTSVQDWRLFTAVLREVDVAYATVSRSGIG